MLLTFSKEVSWIQSARTQSAVRPVPRFGGTKMKLSWSDGAIGQRCVPAALPETPTAIKCTKAEFNDLMLDEGTEDFLEHGDVGIAVEKMLDRAGGTTGSLMHQSLVVLAARRRGWDVKAPRWRGDKHLVRESDGADIRGDGEDYIMKGMVKDLLIIERRRHRHRHRQRDRDSHSQGRGGGNRDQTLQATNRLHHRNNYSNSYENVQFYQLATPLSNYVGHAIFNNKITTQRLLQQANVPVPTFVVLPAHAKVDSTKTNTKAMQHTAVADERMALFKAANLRYPVVFKRNSGSHGVGVVVGIKTDAAFSKLLHDPASTSSYTRYIAEEQAPKTMEHFRILTIDGRVVDVVRRFCSKVVCNGKERMDACIERSSAARSLMSLPAHVPEWGWIANEYGQATIEAAKSFIPPKGKEMTANPKMATGTGGTTVFVPPSEWSPTLQEMVSRIYTVVPTEQRILGVDLMAANISIDWTLPEHDGQMLVNEVNSHPDLSVHFIARSRLLHGDCPFSVFNTVLSLLCM